MKHGLALCVLGCAFLLAGCPAADRGTPVDPELAVNRQRDPDARYFFGRLVDIRPNENLLLISKGGPSEKDWNIVAAKYDRNTRLVLDGRASDLTQLQPMMPCDVKGRMRDGQFFIEIAKFSSGAPATATAPAGK